MSDSSYNTMALTNMQDHFMEIMNNEQVEDVIDLNEKFLAMALGGIEVSELSLLPKLELRVDTTCHSLQVTGEILPSLEYLKLNDSIVRCFRDIGTSFKNVRVLQCHRIPEVTGQPCQWRSVAVSGQEDALSSTSVYVYSSMCQLVTERLAAFALVANMSDLSCFARTSITSSSGCSSLVSSPADPPFRIPLAVKQNLSQLLDPPNSTNSDWRMLAERLGVNRYITFFGTQPSPTEAILNLWEARNRESTAVAGLVNTLRGMGRHDAAQVLDMDTSWP